MKRVPAHLLLSLLVLSAGIGLIGGCSEKEQAAEARAAAAESRPGAAEPGADAGADAAENENRIRKPEKTLVFGEESDQSETDEPTPEIVERSAVLRRNARFLEQSGAKMRYPIDLVIGKLAPSDGAWNGARLDDARAVKKLGIQFMEAAFSGNFEQLQEMSSASAREVLRTQVEKWNTAEARLTEIRIGEIQWDDAAARFDFRILAVPGRAAGSAVCVFEDTQWRVQAIECDCSELQEKYEPVRYTGFPDNYGYFQ